MEKASRKWRKQKAEATGEGRETCRGNSNGKGVWVRKAAFASKQQEGTARHAATQTRTNVLQTGVRREREGQREAAPAARRLHDGGSRAERMSFSHVRSVQAENDSAEAAETQVMARHVCNKRPMKPSPPMPPPQETERLSQKAVPALRDAVRRTAGIPHRVAENVPETGRNARVMAEAVGPGRRRQPGR